jgi:hypothetical protein
MPANEYAVGFGGFAITSLYVIILAFLLRAVGAHMAASDNATAQKFSSALGAIL